MIACANRRGQLESRATVSSENVARLVIHAIAFLILSLVIALILFFVVVTLLVTGTTPYIGCSFIVNGLIGDVVDQLLSMLTGLLVDGKTISDFQTWVASYVREAMSVAERSTCSSDESKIAFALIQFALSLLRSTGVPIPPLGFNATVYEALCKQLFADVLNPITVTATDGASRFIANIDRGGVFCADLSAFGLPEYCSSAVTDWCEQNTPQLIYSSITTFVAGLVLLIVLLGLLFGLPAMAMQAAIAVMYELTVRELALGELHKALENHQPKEEAPEDADGGGEPRVASPRVAAAHPSQVELTVPVAEGAPQRTDGVAIA